MGENMEVKTISALHSTRPFTAWFKKKKKSKLKKCMQVFLQNPTGNAHKGLKLKLLQQGHIQHRQIYYPSLAHRLWYPTKAYSWDGLTEKGFLHLRAIFNSSTTFILNPIHALDRLFCSSNLIYRESPLFSPLFPLPTDQVTTMWDQSSDPSSSLLPHPAAHSQHVKIQVSSSQQISTSPQS